MVIIAIKDATAAIEIGPVTPLIQFFMNSGIFIVMMASGLAAHALLKPLQDYICRLLTDMFDY